MAIITMAMSWWSKIAICKPHPLSSISMVSPGLSLSLSAAPAKVLKYMLDTNRPYSASESSWIFGNCVWEEMDYEPRVFWMNHEPRNFAMNKINPLPIWLHFYFTVDITNNLHKEFGKTVSAISGVIPDIVVCSYRKSCTCLFSPPSPSFHFPLPYPPSLPPSPQCIQRTLDLLVSQQKLVEKVYGKQKVYMANQAQFPDISREELKELERRIGELQGQLKEETAENRAMESRM